jgi:hypothetical protein
VIVAAKQPIEYDGYYFVDVVTRDGFRLTIPARGYNLRSWINFEQSLGAQVEYRAVTEKIWMKTHWTQTPYSEEKPVKKAAKKATKKAPAKKIAKPKKKTT